MKNTLNHHRYYNLKQALPTRYIMYGVVLALKFGWAMPF